jgi:hypothetical protein
MVQDEFIDQGRLVEFFQTAFGLLLASVIHLVL